MKMIEVRAKNNTGRNRISSIGGELYFVPVIDGKEYSHVAETEDMAILIGLGIKYDGLNTQFPKMAARMLGLSSNWAD
jgi:hypothetical protein